MGATVHDVNTSIGELKPQKYQQRLRRQVVSGGLTEVTAYGYGSATADGHSTMNGRPDPRAD